MMPAKNKRREARQGSQRLFFPDASGSHDPSYAKRNAEPKDTSRKEDAKVLISHHLSHRDD